MRTEHHANLLYKNELLLVLSLGTDFSSGRFYKSQSIILRKEQEIPLIKQKSNIFPINPMRLLAYGLYAEILQKKK